MGMSPKISRATTNAFKIPSRIIKVSYIVIFSFSMENEYIVFAEIFNYEATNVGCKKQII